MHVLFCHNKYIAFFLTLYVFVRKGSKGNDKRLGQLKRGSHQFCPCLKTIIDFSVLFCSLKKGFNYPENTHVLFDIISSVLFDFECFCKKR